MKIILVVIALSYVCVSAHKREECVFPFKYKGALYHDCVNLDTASPWCSATENYDGSYFYCDEKAAQAFQSDDGFLNAQKKLTDNAEMLKKLTNAKGISQCDKCDASIRAVAESFKNFRKIADDNERQISWTKEKKNKDMEGFLESIENDLIEITDCPNGFSRYRDHCYKFASANSFNQGTAYCKKLSSQLASIHSQLENDFIFNEVRRRMGTSRNLYLGLNDINNEGKFEWDDATEVDYLNWNRGEPNDVSGEDCTEMLTAVNSKVWNDISCNTGSKNIVCKRHILDL